MKLDMSGVIAAFATETLTITRASAAPTFERGRPVAAPTETIPASAHVQPSGGKDVLRLPEGTRNREVITVWSTVDLVAATEGGPVGDRFEWRGKVFEVQVLKSWVSVGGYCEAVCTRVPYGS